MIDYVVFKMPHSREYMFPAMAVVQAYVKNYNERMNLRSTDNWELRYKIDTTESELAHFTALGVQFTAPAQSEILEPTMLVDMTEEAVDSFRRSGKHIVNVYQALTGVTSAAMPVMRMVKTAANPFKWGVLGEIPCTVSGDVCKLSGDGLATVGDGDLTGVVGVAGWETYLAASKGLAVIELIADDAPRMWLSKWFNRGYRRLEKSTVTPHAIEVAMKNVEDMLLGAANVRS